MKTEVGLEVEAIRRGMEVLGRCNFRRHEGLGFGRLGEREERNVRGLARTGGRAPAASEQRFGVHFVNHGFERADVADVAHRLMEEAARAGFALPSGPETIFWTSETVSFLVGFTEYGKAS